jgi:hypothetical protein
MKFNIIINMINIIIYILNIIIFIIIKSINIKNIIICIVIKPGLALAGSRVSWVNSENVLKIKF